jgi:hypothetical protein
VALADSCIKLKVLLEFSLTIISLISGFIEEATGSELIGNLAARLAI